MNAPRPDPPDEIGWFEALGGAPDTAGQAADALALRRTLALGDRTATRPASPNDDGWSRLRGRLLDELTFEDREWFESIGQDTGTPSVDALEGRRLRAALAHDAEAGPAPARAATQAELLRRIAALAPAPPAPAPPQAAGRRGRLQSLFGLGSARPGWAFAAILALVVGVGVVWQQPQEPERERSAADSPRIGPTGAPTFDVADPRAAAECLVEALAAAGIQADASDQGGYWVVRALLPDPPGAAAELLLRERRLQVPTDRLLEVVFVGTR